MSGLKTQDSLRHNQEIDPRYSACFLRLLLFSLHDLIADVVDVFEQGEVLRLHKAELSCRARCLTVSDDFISSGSISAGDVETETLSVFTVDSG